METHQEGTDFINAVFVEVSYVKICFIVIYKTGPGSLVVRASASGLVRRGFAPRSRHTKGVKNGTSSFLADAHIKREVLGR